MGALTQMIRSDGTCQKRNLRFNCRVCAVWPSGDPGTFNIAVQKWDKYQGCRDFGSHHDIILILWKPGWQSLQLTVVSFVESDRIGGSGFRWICKLFHDGLDGDYDDLSERSDFNAGEKFTSSCPRGGRLIFLTLSRMICRIVFRKAFRNSDVLEK